MSLSRRRFVGSATALAAAPALIEHFPAQAAPSPHAAVAPSPEMIALNHMAYGPRPGDAAQIAALGGLDAYIDQQLNPAAINDDACEAKIAAARLRIRYGAVNETRPLDNLNKTTAELWLIRSNPEFAERMRPLDEVRVATLIRAAYSERQLQQVLVEFWHNHFNIRPQSDATIAAVFPAFHALVRQHCLGNFRVFLEEVGKSTGMMYDLDNVSNRTGGGEAGNENYARELFELQTLGSDNYLKFYDNQHGVGEVIYNGESFARGYVDDDVYEAASCFTGWTIRNGYWGFPSTPEYNTGEFLYWPSWHDDDSKIVLSIDGTITIPRNQPAMQDGKDVYDMTAYHIGTARHICTKLCRRFIGDYPPSDVVEAAVAEWMASRTAPDQIKRVLGVILHSNAFKQTWGQKIKRPFEFLISYIRAAGVELTLTDDSHPDNSNWANIFSRLREAGHGMFEWPTPTGYPDMASYWANTNGTLRRWSQPHALMGTSAWEGNAPLPVRTQTAAVLGTSATCIQVVDYWIERVFGHSISANVRDELIAFIAQNRPIDQPPRVLNGAPDYNNDAALTERYNALVELMAMSPDFQYK
jgi:uncharacterized protein (DUF1800 family)